MSEQMKRCQYCGEEILDVAKKCKHCGSDLEPGASDEAAAKPAADYGMFLLAIPVVATMLILFWVSGMSLLQSPGDIMTILTLATVLGTAIVAAMEASKVGIKSDRKKGTYSATAWFFIITLLWIIGYPAYLYKRRHYGLTNHLLAGILVAFVFVGSTALTTGSQENISEAVKQSMQETLDSDPSFKEYGMSVEDVQVFKQGDNSYKGFVEIRYEENIHNVSVEIIANGESVMWEAPPGSFLFIYQ